MLYVNSIVRPGNSFLKICDVNDHEFSPSVRCVPHGSLGASVSSEPMEPRGWTSCDDVIPTAGLTCWICDELETTSFKMFSESFHKFTSWKKKGRRKVEKEGERKKMNSSLVGISVPQFSHQKVE